MSPKSYEQSVTPKGHFIFNDDLEVTNYYPCKKGEVMDYLEKERKKCDKNKGINRVNDFFFHPE